MFALVGGIVFGWFGVASVFCFIVIGLVFVVCEACACVVLCGGVVLLKWFGLRLMLFCALV